jgi:hypothetical protein
MKILSGDPAQRFPSGPQMGGHVDPRVEHPLGLQSVCGGEQDSRDGLRVE